MGREHWELKCLGTCIFKKSEDVLHSEEGERERERGGERERERAGRGKGGKGKDSEKEVHLI